MVQFRAIASNWNKGDITETDGDMAIIPLLRSRAGHGRGNGSSKL